MKTTKSLSFFVTAWMAAAIGASMGAYGVYEYMTLQGASLKVLALQHLGHVLTLGLLTYALCWAVFYFVLLRPLSRIYLHLYTVGGGRLKALELHSDVREIRTIVDGVNLMLSRLKRGADSGALDKAQKCIAEIRAATHPLVSTDHEDLLGRLATVRDKLRDLEKTLPQILAAQGSLSSTADTGVAHAQVRADLEPDAAPRWPDAPPNHSLLR